MTTLRSLAERCRTLTQYTEICIHCKTNLFAEEEKALYGGRMVLPPIACIVRDGGPPDGNYWNWLAIRTVDMMAAYTHMEGKTV